MNNKIIVVIVLFSLILFTGCTSKPDIMLKKTIGNVTYYINYTLINQTNNITNYINTTTFIYNSTLFTQLNDTPNTYVGHNGKCVVVNALETGLEFKDCATGFVIGGNDTLVIANECGDIVCETFINVNTLE